MNLKAMAIGECLFIVITLVGLLSCGDYTELGKRGHLRDVFTAVSVAVSSLSFVYCSIIVVA